MEPPPLEKPFPADAKLLGLPPVGQWQGIGTVALATAIGHRQSRRDFSPEPLTLDELSFLLWATQGVRQRATLARCCALCRPPGTGTPWKPTWRCCGSTALEPGFYRYLPLEHQLLHLFDEEQMPRKLTEATLGQTFVGRAAVVFIWTTIPYRMEWRYGLAAHKVIALDAGHVCQNLYLACEAIGAGTCAVAAYHQQLMDRLVRVDGEEEFVIYLAPVGKV